jgi:hypothetical protein
MPEIIASLNKGRSVPVADASDKLQPRKREGTSRAILATNETTAIAARWPFRSDIARICRNEALSCARSPA